ncbi:FAD-dependent oxidoreductase [Mesorhizobium australicum]|uniref:NADH:flavin oxidoreductase/NADH oxidase N-terminal domain-containing protein n=1 Tax=Mesorhizobium australicum TaxID=536018 RepID=A0A1X7MT01_9HYPH|nr:NAD(P)/FAD-dependent oxidoreductase [Mesorhizobium australicum]SMH27754.1 hypothetical protein SAMN02982922_0626 [Mesorhizobium australicum]
MVAQTKAFGDSAYPSVFRPFRIGKVEVKNRIFVPAHTTNFATDFLPDEKHIHYHRERARGGVGLIIVEPLRVHRTSLGRSGGLTGADREALPGLQRITQTIKSEGVPVFVQLTHAGRHSENAVDRSAPWGPDDTPWTTSGQIPHPMTRAEIDEVVQSYRNAAELAIEAGFDGMEIHFGHGHLLHQFLSPATNQRADEFGGGLENRMRFPLRVLRAVVDQIGGRVAFGVRVSVDELLCGGLDAEQSLDIIHRTAQERGINFFNASVASYNWPSIGYHVPDMSAPRHPYLDTTLRMRELIGDIPLLTAARYTSLSDAEDALSTGKIDMVGMMRAHIADPQIIAKTQAGREADIRPCIASNFCIEQLATNQPITCMMNPRVGREGYWLEGRPNDVAPLRLLVVGGGPAGLEAARVASELGHRVWLWEATGSLGGKLNVAGAGAGRSDLHRMRDFLIEQAAKAGVSVVLGKRADVNEIRAFAPDRVLLANGATNETTVRRGFEAGISVDDALTAPRDSWHGARVAIWDETGSWGALSTAETLAGAGAEVSFFSQPDSPLWDINIYSRMTALERLRASRVLVRTRVKLLGLDNGSLILAETSLGKEERCGPFDKLVLAMRGQAQTLFMNELQAQALVVSSIGDAHAPRSLLQAVFEGHRAARALVTGTGRQ